MMETLHMTKNNMSQTLKLITLLIVTPLLIACNHHPPTPNATTIHVPKITEQKIHIHDQKKIPGYLLGANINQNQVFILDLIPEKKHHVISVFDIRESSTTKQITLKMGSFQAPGEFYGPSYIQLLDLIYYIFDQNHKIAAMDLQFKRLFSSMTHHNRRFVDFYRDREKTYFVFGNFFHRRKDYQCRVELYRLERNKRPVLEKKLFESSHGSVFPMNGKQFYHVGYFWSFVRGFHKDGRIFYADNSENKFYVYDLQTAKTNAVEMAWLKGTVFSKADAIKLGNYKNPLWPKKMKRKVIYIPNREKIYHFGLYDVGRRLIGVIGRIDIPRLIFRLDLLDDRTGQYRYSIELPFGQDFITMISTESTGFSYHFFDVDRGIYAWGDVDEGAREASTLITYFDIDK